MNEISSHDAADTSPAAPGSLDAIYRKIAWRLMPMLFLGFVVSYLDRSNIGFAKLQMQSELALSESVYGLGAGIFFIGYFLFEVPSNLLLHRFGARRWIARIMISWGVISALMFVVRGPLSFYALRFLLGVAEAGLVPGVILYLTYWFPASRRARMVAMFYAAVAASGIIGGPISGGLMKTLQGAHGLSGWQWLFILEGVPSVLMGFVVWRFLDDSPSKAKWLSDDEKQLVSARLDPPQLVHTSTFNAFVDPSMWLYTAVYFMLCAGIVGVGLWMPSLVQATGVHDLFLIGTLTAIPYLVAIVVMILHGRHSDRTGERRWHIALPMLVGAIGMTLAVRFSHDTTVSLIGLTLTASGILSATPPFWSLPVARLSGRSGAVGVAMVNAVGNLGSFVSPFFIGYTRDITHSTSTGFYSIAVGLCLGALLILMARVTHAVPGRSDTSAHSLRDQPLGGRT
ncbi:MFS transporter [Paraburkholderia sp. PREW-6R]|uniref:MFS transporter n=1 Tax=Paraburkholderia sp. PREW-6R TaxID=3141544 RepID=UPI0031F5562A